MIKAKEYIMGKPKTVTDQPLRRPKKNEPLELLGKLHKAETTKERRVLVREVMGDFFYAWGEKRRAWKPYLTYEENMDRLYIGEPR